MTCKKSFSIFLFLIISAFALALSACSKSETPSPEPSNSASEPTFKSVLLGNSTFFSAESGEDLYISDIGKASGYDVQLSVSAFTFADLDNDWTDELICSFGTDTGDYGFLVLRRDGDKIYGYSVPYRAMTELKADGTFSFSGGAADSGHGRMSFTATGYEIIQNVYSASSYDEENNLTVSYFSAGEKIDEAEFNSSIEAQDSKPDADWKEFNEENINGI